MRNIKPLPPLADLEKWFEIKGRDLLWKQAGIPSLIGSRAGYRRPDGYIEIRKQNHKMLAHRVAYYLATRQDPGSFFIDHIDGDPSNNAPSNLRLASQSENMRNVRRLRANNKSGQHGVHRAVVGGIVYWKASVYLHGKQIHLGSYATKEEAVAVRQVAERLVYGDYAPICLDHAAASFPAVLDASVDQSQPESF